MTCRYCGAELSPDVKFCSSCGRSQEQEPATSPPWGESSASGSIPPLPPATGQTSAQTGRWISDGWQLITSDWLQFVLMSLVLLVINGCIPFVLSGPLAAGMHIACIRKMMSNKAEVGDLFKGFNFFGAALLAYLVIAVFSFVGFLVCIIPGLVVAAMYQFTYLFIVDKKMDFWEAMQASHGLVKKDYFGFTLFLLALIFINIAGALLCFVGLLFTIPLLFAATTVAYRDLVQFENRENF